MRPASSRTSFVGRQDALALLDRHWRQGSCLVTLCGPGGMGKTRLAQRFLLAGPSKDAPWSDAWFCDLSQATTLGDIVRTVAHVTGVDLTGTMGDAVERVGLHLARSPRPLLILDNLEQVVAQVPSFLGRWLELAPRLMVLATSRERLGVDGEHLLPLEPLGMPPGRVDAPETLAASEAVQLFTQRTQQLVAGFRVDAGNAASVAAIVSLLEGMPLAIELAASRMGLMDAAQLLAMLRSGAPVLSHPKGAHPERQRTMQATLDWSWRLLSREEQAALAASALFAGPFTLSAASSVFGHDALETLQALHDKSLLIKLPGNQEPTFRLSVPVREYAAHALSQRDDAPALHQRHQAWLLDQAVHWSARLDSRDDVAAASHMTLLEDALMVLARSPDAPVDAQLQAALALDAWLVRTGPVEVHQDVLSRALERAEPRSPSLLLARARGALGRVQQFTASSETSVRTLEAALELARHGGDPGTLGSILGELASLHRRTGQLERARPLFAQALDNLEKSLDGRALGRLLGDVGIFHKEQGDLAAAHAHYARALLLLREAGDARFEGRVLADLGALHQEEGNLAQAKACFLGALELQKQAPHRRFEGVVLTDLGGLAFEEGDLPAAYAHLTNALDVLALLRDRRTSSRVEAMLGGVLAAQGRVDEAALMLENAHTFLALKGYALWATCADLHRGHVDLALHQRQQLPGNAHLQRAMARLADAGRSSAAGQPSPSQLSDDVRLAARILERALQRAGAVPGLRVGPACRRFQVAGQEDVDLESRPMLRRLVAALVDARREHPGKGLDEETLVARTWPGERMAAASGHNRLQVALATLRKLGLRSLLLRHEDGYLLDPAVDLASE
jgi:predicted ATPase